MRMLVLPGDGIGPEIVAVAVDVAEAGARPRLAPRRNSRAARIVGLTWLPRCSSNYPHPSRDIAMKRSSLQGGVHQIPQRYAIENRYGSSLDADQAFVAESREQSAYGLQLEPQVTTDLLARHAQHEFAR